MGQRRVAGQLHQRKEEKRPYDEERNRWERDREGVCPCTLAKWRKSNEKCDWYERDGETRRLERE